MKQFFVSAFLCTALALAGCGGDEAKQCTPNCSGKTCGSDGCGGTCGTCGANQGCDTTGVCKSICIPDCSGKECGDDGCGGVCGPYLGNCAEGMACGTDGKCEICTPQCTSAQVCGNDSKGCSCGVCPAGKSCGAGGQCVECQKQCDGKTCGSDGCGGTCGTCPGSAACSADGTCLACTPDAASCAGKQCGLDKNGCPCGTCPNGAACLADGTCGSCPETGGTVKLENLCTVLDGSFKKWMAWQYQACGNVIDDNDPKKLHLADIDHFDAEFFSGAGYGYVYPIGPYNDFLICGKGLKGSYEALKSAVASGHVCYDSKAVDDCMAAGAAAKAAGKYGSAEAAVCKKFFTPNQAEGDPCDFGWECKDGLYCKPTDGGKASCGGVCSKPLPANASCGDSDVCAPGTKCMGDPAVNVPDGGIAPRKCITLKKAGEDCSKVSCDDNLMCKTVSANADAGLLPDGGTPKIKICIALKGQGETCTQDEDCNLDLYCLPASAGSASKTCQKEPAPVGLNATCGGTTGVSCADCLFCNGATDTVAGKCAAAPKIGDDCIGGKCPSLDGNMLECNKATNKCQLKPREGEACVVDPAKLPQGTTTAQMQQGNCLYIFENYCKRTSATSAGVCSKLPAAGEACGNTFDSAPYCLGDTYCKGMTATAKGKCTALEPDGTACDPKVAGSGDVCMSGYCIANNATAPTSGKCGGPAKLGQACAPVWDAEYDELAGYLCDEGTYCNTTSKTCVALKAAGEKCASASECATGTCGGDKTCVMDCLTVPGTDTDGCGSYDGFNWFAKYIFAAGTLVFLASRRRNRK